MAKAIQLVENRKDRAMLEKESRWDVLLNGIKFGQLYFNMRGYVGYLPTPPSEGQTTPGKLTIGEKGLRAYRKEVAQLNQEWAIFLNRANKTCESITSDERRVKQQ